MEMTTYYGMDKNPFTKDATVSTLYASNDFNQMTTCTQKNTPDKGVFTINVQKTLSRRYALSMAKCRHLNDGICRMME